MSEPDNRIELADKLISDILDTLGLEFRADFDCEMWLEPLEEEETTKPTLMIVDTPIC
jgi:hypothetical protein